ncbi:MAG: CRISPR system precrRNA processing endoribonuclease RAMP protein Cas6 [Limnochordales bacterium]|nr:CRISPR system precrRNA processing endoribonuclease RAMP protein Cas6 [Limnochordales bacterium]
MSIESQVELDETLFTLQRKWERLTVAWLNVTLTAVEPLELPPYKGSTFRGAFGWAFQRVCCLTGWPSCSGCVSRSVCAYAQVFEAMTVHGTIPPLRGLQDISRPFVLRPPRDRQEKYQPGDRLQLELLLFGRAIPLTPLFIRAFLLLAAQGVGRGRGRMRVERVEAWLPQGDAVNLFDLDSGNGATRGQRPFYATLGQWLGNSRPVAVGTNGKCETVSIEFITMTRFKHDGRLVKFGPPFSVLVASLLRRLTTLWWYCGGEEEAERFAYIPEGEKGMEDEKASRWLYRELVERAAEVRLLDANTRWDDWVRFSYRQQQRMLLGGLTGRAVYDEEARLFLPLLKAGEIVHVGKGTTFGLGQYRLS